MTRMSQDRFNRKQQQKRLQKKGLLPMNNSINGFQQQPNHQIVISFTPQGLVSFATTENIPVQLGVFACDFVKTELMIAYRNMVVKQQSGIIEASPTDIPSEPAPNLRTE